MMAHDLSSVGAGFSHEAFGSQAVFRSALMALSHPGRCIPVEHDAELPRRGNAAAAVFLLAMLDADCGLWLSPSLRDSDAAMWLRFHTGCQLLEHAEMAQFVWVGAGDLLPELQSLQQGSDESPDQSATCVVDVSCLSAGPVDDADAQHWTLSGPGIREQATLGVTGLPADFAAQWALNNAGFPRGVDLFLATHDQLVGLPRTTRIHTPVEA
ncbi:phosphonate C-P lyase system protein PhnH [Hydrogenophaga sp.]|uniref:phosphonate C-P lyase system protein PhnH n=1 Tax=Hydrogenophaga sp. TaxID=1904254 RepID=UPI0026247A4A|nr:phosphonate C-P lyase system protein PhnH [Hydrogenophaga sp.]MDM7948421.1 phosphonate C-P lyase system protein PhnH [Hydrogenophaga sp.]